MALQVALLSEALPAQRTKVRFLARVNELVPLEDALLGEVLPAVRAAVRLLASVNALVPTQTLPLHEALAALGAGVRFLLDSWVRGGGARRLRGRLIVGVGRAHSGLLQEVLVLLLVEPPHVLVEERLGAVGHRAQGAGEDQQGGIWGTNTHHTC